MTLEDLLEEIVGEIEDEYDMPDDSVQRIDDRTVRVDGTFPIDDFNEQFQRDLPQEDYHTLAGFVFGELGRAPEAGDEVVWDGLRFEVVRDRRARASSCSRSSSSSTGGGGPGGRWPFLSCGSRLSPGRGRQPWRRCRFPRTPDGQRRRASPPACSRVATTPARRSRRIAVESFRAGCSARRAAPGG